MWIKICANTNLEDARLAVELGADAVGFVFAPSRRQVKEEQAAEMVQGLPEGAETVGVFATDDPLEIGHEVARAGLTAAQLHNGFDAGVVRALSAEWGGALKIIQTVAYAVDVQGADDRGAADEAFERALRTVFAEPAVWAVLLDTAKAGVSGGLGVAFDWARVAGLVERAMVGVEPRPKVILAGGLTADNVARAVATLRPWGVDVASGVESAPGKKDAQRLQAFLRAAREAAEQAGL